MTFLPDFVVQRCWITAPHTVASDFASLNPGYELRVSLLESLLIMPALVAGIHVFLAHVSKTWMAGTSPAVTKEDSEL